MHSIMNNRYCSFLEEVCVSGRSFRIIGVILSGALILFYLSLTGCSDSQTSPSDPVEPRAAVYNDHGVWSEGVNRLNVLLSEWGWTVENISAYQINSGYLNTEFDLIVFPGGDAGSYKLDISDTGTGEIRNFVNDGGGYIGICAGAFWASDRIVWHGREIDYPLNLLPGTATGPLDELCTPGSQCWTDVRFSTDYPAGGDLSGVFSCYYYDGPEMDTTGAAVFARYETLDSPAAVALEYGAGKVAVIGVHPEMSSATEPVLKSMVEWTMRSGNATMHRQNQTIIREQRAVQEQWTGKPTLYDHR
jgi:glutamine amidotransferase-like uncharacterized protein